MLADHFEGNCFPQLLTSLVGRQFVIYVGLVGEIHAPHSTKSKYYLLSGQNERLVYKI